MGDLAIVNRGRIWNSHAKLRLKVRQWETDGDNS
jgi:hypothetical protein